MQDRKKRKREEERKYRQKHIQVNSKKDRQKERKKARKTKRRKEKTRKCPSMVWFFRYMKLKLQAAAKVHALGRSKQIYMQVLYNISHSIYGYFLYLYIYLVLEGCFIIFYVQLKVYLVARVSIQYFVGLFSCKISYLVVFLGLLRASDRIINNVYNVNVSRSNKRCMVILSTHGLTTPRFSPPDCPPHVVSISLIVNPTDCPFPRLSTIR